MKRITYYLILFLVAAMGLCACGNKKRTMTVDNSVITLDGKMFTVASADFDYARVPREYWNDRLENMARMGLNTITVKAPWMLHEPAEGNFDFAGMKDVAALCRMAQEKELLVWLHLGPFIGSEWDMGGLPWWLLNVDGIRLRSVQPAFMQRVGRYFEALGKELSPLLLENGGNIAIVQVEESQGIEKKDKSYLQALVDCARNSGFDKALMFTSATRNTFMQTALNDVHFAIDMNSEVKADEHFVGVTKFRYNAPLVCSSLGGDYKTVWGGETAARNWNKVFMRMFELLQRGSSVSIDGVLEGNSFGSTAGAEIVDGKYRPYITAHNTDAMINFNGECTDDYQKFRKTLHVYAQDGKTVTEPLAPSVMSSFDDVAVEEFAPLSENLPQAIESDKVKTMEQCGIGTGAILYSASLPALKDGASLSLKGIHDYARIYVNGKKIAVVDRRMGEDADIALPASAEECRLDILVESTGRVGNVKGYKDYKGITKGVELKSANGADLQIAAWKMYPLPSDYNLVSSMKFGKLPESPAPGCYRAKIKKPEDGDFFLFVGYWGNGEAWINGHSLGRFRHEGPQRALYVPVCWMNEGDNELIIADWDGPSKPIVKGLDYPLY